MMDGLWRRYARIWTLEGEARAREMRACLAPAVTYADPRISLAGCEAFAAYMDGFRGAFPGHAFHIRAVTAHHDGSLARWDLADADGGMVFPGLSFGRLAEDGRFLSLHGFFGGIEELLR